MGQKSPLDRDDGVAVKQMSDCGLWATSTLYDGVPLTPYLHAYFAENINKIPQKESNHTQGNEGKA